MTDNTLQLNLFDDTHIKPARRPRAKRDEKITKRLYLKCTHTETIGGQARRTFDVLSGTGDMNLQGSFALIGAVINNAIADALMQPATPAEHKEKMRALHALRLWITAEQLGRRESYYYVFPLAVELLGDTLYSRIKRAGIQI